MQLTTPLEYDDLKHCDLPVDFTERVKNVSIRYLSAQQPKGVDLDNWLVLPLYKHGHDLPIDNDGKTALLLANVDVLFGLLEQWQQRISFDKENPTVNPSKRLKNSLDGKPRPQSTCSSQIKERPSAKSRPPAPKMAKLEPLDQPQQVVVPLQIPKTPIVHGEVKEKPVLIVEESNPLAAEPKTTKTGTTVTLSLILEQMKFSEKEKYQLRKLLEAEGADERMSVDSMRRAIQMAYTKFASTATEIASSNSSIEDSITPTGPAVSISNSTAATAREWAASEEKGTQNTQAVTENTSTGTPYASASQNAPLLTPETTVNFKPSSLASFTRKTPIISKTITPVKYTQKKSAGCTHKTRMKRLTPIPVNYKVKTPVKFVLTIPAKCTPKEPAEDNLNTPRTPPYGNAETDIVLPVTPKKHQGFIMLPHHKEYQKKKRNHIKESDDEQEFNYERSVSKELSLLYKKSDSPSRRIEFTPSPVQGRASRDASPLHRSTPVYDAPIQHSAPMRNPVNQYGITSRQSVSFDILPSQARSIGSMSAQMDQANSYNQPMDISPGSRSSNSLLTLSTCSEPSSPNRMEDYEKEGPSHSSHNYQQVPDAAGCSKNYQQM